MGCCIARPLAKGRPHENPASLPPPLPLGQQVEPQTKQQHMYALLQNAMPTTFHNFGMCFESQWAFHHWAVRPANPRLLALAVAALLVVAGLVSSVSWLAAQHRRHGRLAHTATNEHSQFSRVRCSHTSAANFIPTQPHTNTPRRTGSSVHCNHTRTANFIPTQPNTDTRVQEIR